MNSLLNKKKTSKLPDSENDTDLCNRIITFFTDKVKKIEELLKSLQTSQVEQSETVHDSSDTLCSFEPVTEEDVLKIITSSASKSCILDPIPTYLLKECIDVLLPTITHIINLSLQSAAVPGCFKTAAVTPLLKKATLDHNCLKNFRPVSNLPFISKILEKVVLKQINSHKILYNLSEKFQSAYRTDHSTETALLRIQNDLLQSMDKGKCCFLVLLDLSAAFDTVNHGILLQRLSQRFGIRDRAFEWIRSYLSDRNNFVAINTSESTRITQHCNVPQGSVLGPTFFSDYIAPLGEIFRRWGVSYHSYADDTQIYMPFTPGVDEDHAYDKLVGCIGEVRTWMAYNFLKLNDDKTEFLVVGSSHFLPKVRHSDICIGEETVRASVHVKNIGAVLDGTLSMDKEVSAKCKSAWWQLFQLSKIKKYLTVEQLKTVIFSLVLCRLDQNNSLLFGLPHKSIMRLQKIQNAAARLVCSARRFDDSLPLLSALHWLPIEQRIIFKIALLVYKCRHNRAPSYLSELVTRYAASFNSRRSDSNCLDNPRTFKKWGDRSFSACGPKVWNSLPDHVINCQNITCFKKKLKTHLCALVFDLPN